MEGTKTADEIRAEIDARRDCLRRELAELDAMAAAKTADAREQLGLDRPVKLSAKLTPERKRAPAKAKGVKRGRPKGSGKRGGEAVAILEKATGPLTIPEIAEVMGIKQNYLYRVMPALQQEGRVVKVKRKGDGKPAWKAKG